MTEFHPIRKAMIVIAVSNYSGAYPNLPGTLTSAKRIANWARKPGKGRSYSVLEITDEAGKAVTTDRLRKEIKDFLENEIIDRLIVYFAGHGLVRGASDQFWLLTNAADDRREGIEFYSFIDGLKRYGIGASSTNLNRGQLCIIVDACRNTAFQAIDFIGDAILTTATPAIKLDVEYLLATTTGHYV